jgi:iron(III) transport system ATP-binding protein
VAEPLERTVLHVDDVVVRYGEVIAVDHVSLEAGCDAITALVGPSGCGKTSLLRSIAGFEIPSSGKISIGGQVVTAPGSWVEPEQRSVGMVFQQGALFPHLDVRRNVGFGVVGNPDARTRTARVLDLVGLTDLAHRYPDELSGGQQQRVALARALAPSPDIVLLDEPFANLDATLRRRVREEVCSILRAAGTTAIIVTHDQEEAMSIADRLVVMRDGRLLQAGSPRDVYENPQSAAVAEFIGDGQLVECRIEKGRLDCELGSAECPGGKGAGLLLVRAEDLTLHPISASFGVPGRIAERRYFGHDRLDLVRLDSGRIVQVRASGDGAPAAESPVRVCLRRKRYRVYLRDGETETVAQATPLDMPA